MAYVVRFAVSLDQMHSSNLQLEARGFPVLASLFFFLFRDPSSVNFFVLGGCHDH